MEVEEPPPLVDEHQLSSRACAPTRRWAILCGFLATFVLGFLIRGWLLKREVRLAAQAFPSVVRHHQPLKIDIHWRPRLIDSVESPDGQKVFTYSGSAPFVLHNDSQETIRIQLPPQASFSYSVEERFSHAAKRNQMELPEWANQQTTLVLTPDERRTFESTIGMTVFEELKDTDGIFPGFYAFDFAAPSNETSESFVTGTVFAWGKITLDAHK